jgi:two-component system nitrogen regulation sensor histidine kinase NtrY
MSNIKKLISAIPNIISILNNSRKFSYGLAACAVIFGIATVVTLTAPESDSFNIMTVVTLLYIDGILMLLLCIVVGSRLFLLWQDRRRRTTGSGLQGRLVTVFSLVAVTPAILVAIFSALFLNHGLEVWFSERVNLALKQSVVVAKSYLNEHRKNITSDALSIANTLNYNAPRIIGNPNALNELLTSETVIRSLSEATTIDGTGKVIGRSRYSFTDSLEAIPTAAFTSATDGKIAILDSASSEQVRALIKLNRFIDTYLIVERFVDPRVINHIESINKAVHEYHEMEKKRGGVQITFVVIFGVVAFLLLLAAAWIGLTIARQLASPIVSLINASEDVSKGNLNVRVNVAEEDDEIRMLGQAFNKMTVQLETQRDGLIEVNRELDERRQFTETVLGGVSAGVIGLDQNGLIHLPNKSASALIATDLDQCIGKKLKDIVPEMALLLDQLTEQGDQMRQSEIELIRNDASLILHVRVTAEYLKDTTNGYVVTFDDVTELLSAQRNAAWADVARRIAHEIKNPLTPIQLSAERLERKYLNEIKTDPEIFTSCISTITRQVADIGQMVDEFSNFSRMPKASRKIENISEICRQAVFLEENRTPHLTFTMEFPENDVTGYCDNPQISRVLTNLLKNASESVIGKAEEDGADISNGQITIRLEQIAKVSDSKSRAHKNLQITISDNGKGLPSENRDRLTEPYVTTRAKGTGLGLAIVKKIIEDHNGELRLSDNPEGGAMIQFNLPAEPQQITNKVKKDPLKAEIELAMHSTRE